MREDDEHEESTMLGDALSDIKKLLAALPGGSSLGKQLDELIKYIRKEAEAGAKQAIPDIEAAVKVEAKKTIKPYVIAALALGGGGMLLGLSSWARRSRSSSGVNGYRRGLAGDDNMHNAALTRSRRYFDGHRLAMRDSLSRGNCSAALADLVLAAKDNGASVAHLRSVGDFNAPVHEEMEKLEHMQERFNAHCEVRRSRS